MPIQNRGMMSMRKKIILPVGLIAFVLLLLAVNSIMSFKKEIPLDLTTGLEVQFNGENGSGTVSVTKNIEYDGLNETVKRFIDSVTYSINPESGLSNGDLITVTAHYDDELRKLGSVVVENPTKEIQVEDLLTISVSDDKETVYAEGYEIPGSMAGSEEDRRLYIEYMKSLEQPKDETAVPEDWSQGQVPSEDLREERVFLISEFNAYKNDAFDQAEEYGRSSSQEYQVRPVVEADQVIGWKTVFR